MYKGKHISTTPARKAKAGKSAVVIIAIVLAAVLAVGGTVAYLTTQTDVITNIFSPSAVKCTVVGNTDGSYSIENSGDVDAYIRVAIVCNWMDGDGNVHWRQPEFSVNAGEGWFCDSDGDGFYYYKHPIEAKGPDADAFDTTSEFSVTLNPSETDPKDYTFAVQVLAEAIQSEPADAVTEAWDVTISGSAINK